MTSIAYAGLDVGTSSCKIVIYDRNGNILYKNKRLYKEQGKDGIRELNPRQVLLSINELLKQTASEFKYSIRAMAVTSIGESIVCIDENQKSLHNAMVTGDSRGIAETERILDTYSAKQIFEITGLPPSEMYGLPKYMWLNENTRAIKDAKYIFFFEDFISYYLTGKRMVSYSSASRSMALDINKKLWSTQLLSLAGIREEQLSIPVSSGTVMGNILPSLSQKLGLNPDLKIVVGGHDQSCAALGSGLYEDNVGECGMGTCEFMFFNLPKGDLSDKSDLMIDSDLTKVPYVFENSFLTSLEVTTSGILKNWCRDVLFSGDIVQNIHADKHKVWDLIDEKASNIETDILVLPQFGSSGNPHINYNVRGTITGLTTSTTPEEIYRGVLEGISFQLYLAYEKALPLGMKLDRVIATGGGSVMDFVLQMRADIFNMEISRTISHESGTLGCMILASYGMGEFPTIVDTIKNVVKTEKTFYPNNQKNQAYMQKFERYKRLYELMHEFR